MCIPQRNMKRPQQLNKSMRPLLMDGFTLMLHNTSLFLGSDRALPPTLKIMSCH